MKIRTILTPASIAAVSVAMLLTFAPSAFGWDEDFQSYTDGQALSEGPNPNLWTALTAGERIQHDVTFGPDYASPDPPIIATVGDFGGGDIRLGANGWAAAKAPLPPPDSSVETLQFFFTGSDGSRTSIGIELRDSINGGAVSIHTDYAGWIIDTDPLGSKTGHWFGADFNAYETTELQRIELEFDFDNDEVHVLATADDEVTPIYNSDANVIRSTNPVIDGTRVGDGPLSLPASFVPDTIVVYGGIFGGNSSIDRIFYSSGAGPPPPPTDFNWNVTDSGSWEEALNWSSGGPPGDPIKPGRSHHTAIFGDAIGSEARTVFTDAGVSVNSISFTNTMGGTYRLAGGPAYNLIVSTAGPLPSLAVSGGGSHDFQAPLGIHADTAANIEGGSTLVLNNSLTLNGNTLTKTGTGELAIRNDLLTGGGMVSLQQGTLSGNGAVSGDLNNSGGTVAPGNSSGVLAVDGNYTQGSDGTLAMEIEGLAGPGEGGHDQLAVVGTASLDGTLGVTPVGGYADPTVRGNSDSFTLLTSTGLSGTFATVNYDGAALDSGGHAGNGLFRKVDYTANDVVLTNLLAKAGDVEGDSDVDITDFNALASNYDPSGANAPHDWTEGDFDDNDTIDLTDFNGLASNFAPGGYGDGPGQVPEPSAILLLAIGLLATVCWRRYG